MQYSAGHLVCTDIRPCHREGKRHGHGCYTFGNGDRYMGEYENDVPHGHGVYLFASGQAYEGQWQNGSKHGWCVYSLANGQQWAGDRLPGFRSQPAVRERRLTAMCSLLTFLQCRPCSATLVPSVMQMHKQRQT